MLLQKEIEKRNLPDLFTFSNGDKVTSLEDWQKRRSEIMDILARECYGYIPNLAPAVDAELIAENNDDICGKAIYRKVMLHIRHNPIHAPASDAAKDCISLPLHLTIPKSAGKAPMFVVLSFNLLAANEFLPLEEIIDNGYGVASFCYQDIAFDRMESGRGMNYNERENEADSFGTIGKWAWGASRVLDYLLTVEEIDKDRIALTGASRLGKTALWAAACDPRFAMVVPMIDGTGGASLYRGNTLYGVDRLIDHYPYWFCGNFQKYLGKVEQLPFDAHFLVAAMAPRPVYICCGNEDIYTDQIGEFLACMAASPVYELYGKRGMVAEDSLPSGEVAYTEGSLGMHIRKGPHYVSRHDWLGAIRFRDLHKV